MAKRAKQTYIEGTEPPSIPALDSAVEAYVECRDQRMEMLEEEVEKKSRLLELMKNAMRGTCLRSASSLLLRNP